MKNPNQPIQFDFVQLWDTKINNLKRVPSIKESFQQIKAQYKAMMEMACESIEESDKEKARIHYEIAMQEARTYYWDLDWLREKFEGADLVYLSLAIAEELFPKKSWEILEDGLDNAIVTDADRTIVFDIKNFDQISAATSLALFDDHKFVPTEADLEDARKFIDERISQDMEMLEKLQKHMGFH